MLLTLLPYMAWADEPLSPQEDYPVDISSGWTIELENDFATYTGGDLTPVVRLVNAESHKYIPANKLDVSWDAAERINVPASGYYTVTVKPNQSATGTYGDFNKSAKLYVLKYELAVTNPGAVALATSRDWNGDPLTLVAVEPILNNTFGNTVKISYSTDNVNWQEGVIPVKTAVGEYTVWYKVDGTTNYVGIPSTKIGTVNINGVPYEGGDITAPQAIGDLKFIWDASAKTPKEQALITAGSVTNIDQQTTPKGTMKYKYRLQTNPASEYSEYSTAIPTANAAGIYDVMWKIFPTENTGFIAEEAAQALEVEIDAIEPETVTSATGKTGLKYLGDGVAPQELLASAGTATDGATPKYQIRRKDIGGAYPANFDAPVEYADVKGSKAGVYELKTIVPAGGNYTAKAAESTIEVTIAQIDALTSAPTAISNLVWNAQPQVLIAAGEGTCS